MRLETTQARIAKIVMYQTLACRSSVMRLQTFHHASCSHYGLQLADYCCRAMFRKWERGEPTYHDRIDAAVRSELDIFRTET